MPVRPRVVGVNRRNEESAGERSTLGQRRRKCPEQAYKKDSFFLENNRQQQQQQREQSPPAAADTRPNSGAYHVQEPAADEDSNGGSLGSPRASIIAASPAHKENVLSLNHLLNPNVRKRIRSSSLSSSASSSLSASRLSRCPDTEYRREFRCNGFRPSAHALGAAAGRPSGRRGLLIMSRSATADLRPSSANASTRRLLLPLQQQHLQQAADNSPAQQLRSQSVCAQSEYRNQFKDFDDYVYMEDVGMFRNKKDEECDMMACPDQPDACSGPASAVHRSMTWLVRCDTKCMSTGLILFFLFSGPSEGAALRCPVLLPTVSVRTRHLRLRHPQQSVSGRGEVAVHAKRPVPDRPFAGHDATRHQRQADGREAKAAAAGPQVAL